MTRIAIMQSLFICKNILTTYHGMSYCVWYFLIFQIWSLARRERGNLHVYFDFKIRVCQNFMQSLSCCCIYFNITKHTNKITLH